MYKLTHKGIDLFPIMVEINLWADKYFTLPAERKAIIQDAKKDKQSFIENSMAALSEK